MSDDQLGRFWQNSGDVGPTDAFATEVLCHRLKKDIASAKVQLAHATTSWPLDHHCCCQLPLSLPALTRELSS